MSENAGAGDNGGTAPVINTNTGASTTVPFGQTNTGSAPAGDFRSTIPEKYRSAKYLEDVDSPDKLFSKLDGAMQLVGKRPAGIPQDNDPQEKWDEFYKAAGRPEKADDYTFEKVEGLNYSDEFLKEVQGLMHQTGLSKKQAIALQKGFDGLTLKHSASMNEKQKAAKAADDAAFDKLVAASFGDKRDERISKAQEILMANIPADMKSHLEKLSGPQAALLAIAIDNIAKNHIAPDKLPVGGNGGTSGDTAESIRAQARELMKKPEFNDEGHPNNAAIRKQVSDLYARLK